VAETEKFIRPGSESPWGSASYGTGDGSTYANAYSGLKDSDIRWDAAVIWWLVGTFAVTTGNAGSNRVTLIGGTPTKPRVLRFDYDLVNEPGIIWGTKLDAHTWALDGADAGGNTYKTTFNSLLSLIVDLTNSGKDHSLLTGVSSITDVYATAESWFSDGTTTWIHLVGGADPTGRVIIPVGIPQGNTFVYPTNVIFYCGSIYKGLRINDSNADMTNVQFRRLTPVISRGTISHPQCLVKL